jgi:hypothetical protein
LRDLRDVHIVQHALMSDDNQAMVLSIETYGLQFFVDFDLGGRPFRVKVLGNETHELKSKKGRLMGGQAQPY